MWSDSFRSLVAPGYRRLGEQAPAKRTAFRWGNFQGVVQAYPHNVHDVHDVHEEVRPPEITSVNRCYGRSRDLRDPYNPVPARLLSRSVLNRSTVRSFVPSS